MKNIKDITISIFAIIGFVTILSSFNNQSEPQVTNGTPESHVWEVAGFDNDFFMWNKQTGELRKINGNAYFSEKDGQSFMYGTMIELPAAMRIKAR